ncbi:MAG: DUF4135 domain-containing protein, partial [Cyanobacteria bacterium J06649_11]
MNTDDLLFLINRSATLYERIDGTFCATQSDENNRLMNSRLSRWKDIVAPNDERKFLKRLQWEGFDIETVYPLLGSVQLTKSNYVPSWTKIIKSYCNAIADTECSYSSNVKHDAEAESSFPFEDLLIPFVHIANRKIEEKSPEITHLISDEVQLTLERALLHRLSSVASPTLLLEFSVFKSFHTSHLATVIAQTTGKSSSGIYKKFIDSLSRNIGEFFKKYPVLARLLSTTVELWTEFISEFFQRVKKDKKLIEKQFFRNKSLGLITELTVGISDNHKGGKSVLIATFSSAEKKIVYKP